MAKFKYTNLVDGPFGLGALYSMSPGSELGAHNDSKAIYAEEGTGNGIEFYGENLEFKGDKITDGRIDKIRFVDNHGHAFIVATDGDYNAATLSKYLLTDMATFFQQVFARKDTILGTDGANYLIGAGNDDVIKGRGGMDEIFAAGGRDIVTGGGGSDLFIFTGVSQIDIITDFDSEGGPGSQDYITTPLDVLDIRQAGAHTIIELDKGGIIKLLNVDATTVTVPEDFV